MKAILAALIVAVAGTAQASTKAELDQMVRSLLTKFEVMQQKPDKRIPVEHLRNARGIVLLDRTKAGFLFAYQGGGGVVMVKDAKSGKWSPLAFLKATEASLGFQIGGEQSFVVILLMDTNATQRLTWSKIEFSGEASGTAGDTSAGVEAPVTEGLPSTLIYTDRTGLYGGAAFKGGNITSDDHANTTYHGKYHSIHDLLFGRKVKPDEPASELARKIATYSKEGKK